MHRKDIESTTIWKSRHQKLDIGILSKLYFENNELSF